MDFSDKIKLERLEKTFELNFKLTRLYANYLEHYNEIISAEMIEALCLFAFIGDGELHPNEFYIIANLLLSSYDDFPEEFEEFAKLLNG